MTSPCSFLWNIRRIGGFFFTRGTTRHKLVFLLSMGIFFFSVFAQIGVGKIDAMYQMNRPFCFSSLTIGLYSAGKGTGQFLLGTFFLKILQVIRTVHYKIVDNSN